MQGHANRSRGSFLSQLTCVICSCTCGLVLQFESVIRIIVTVEKASHEPGGNLLLAVSEQTDFVRDVSNVYLFSHNVMTDD